MAPGKLRSGGAKNQQPLALIEVLSKRVRVGVISVSQDLLGWYGNNERARERFIFSTCTSWARAELCHLTLRSVQMTF